MKRAVRLDALKAYRILRTILAAIGLIAVVGLAVYLFVENDFPSTREEVARLSSPNNKYDAVIVDETLMSFGSPRFALFIVPHGKAFHAGSDAFKHSNYETTHLEGQDVSWVNDLQLVVKRYPRVRIHKFFSDYYDVRYPTKTQTHTEYRTVRIDLNSVYTGEQK